MLSRAIIFLSSIFCGFGFNIDVNQVIIKRGTKGSLFGISVTPHYINASKEIRIIVGAPLANTTESTAQPVGIIYKCPLTIKSDDCQKMKTPNERRYKTKRQLWGLSTVSASPFGGSKLFACAPRARRQAGSSDRLIYTGLCMAVGNNLEKYTRIEFDNSCGAQMYWVINKFCLGGMSVATNKLNNVLIGKPYKSRGPIQNIGALNYYSGKYNYETLDLMKYDIRSSTTPVYIGWSTAIGHIYSKENYSLIAGGPVVPVSADRVENFEKLKDDKFGAGLVLTFTKTDPKIKPAQQLVGQQFASRFGHSILVIDINSDGWDDLLVGAPEFRSEKNSIPFGAVYLYINDKGRKLELRQSLQAPQMGITACRTQRCDRARFGFALSHMQDLNNDGFPDVAISAPGEGNGTIYIYLGSKTGRLSSPVQKFSHTGMRNLGYALGAGMDLDGNGYPDLVAGAWESDAALVFRTRPIVRIEVSSSFSKSPISPNFGKNGWVSCLHNKAYCFNMTVKFRYQRARVRDKTDGPLAGDLTLQVDVRYGEKKRVKISGSDSEETKAVTFTRTGSTTNFSIVVDKKEIIDTLTPIIFNISWSLKMDAPPKSRASDLSSINNYPVYDSVNSFKVAQLDWINDCPPGGCTSDLQLSVESSLSRETDPSSPAHFVYLIGDSAAVWMNFTVQNTEGIAYFLRLSFKFSGITVIADDCPILTDDQSLLIVKYADPLASGERVKCNLKLSSNIKTYGKFLNFSASVTTVSRNLNRHPTKLDFLVSVRVQANVQLTSSTNPSQVFVSKTKVIGARAIKHEKKIGDRRIRINFKLENQLKSTLRNTSLTIWWPYEVAGNLLEPHGKYLLYMLKFPIVETSKLNSISCDEAALSLVVNPEKVRVLDSKWANASVSARYRPLPRLPTSPPAPSAAYELCPVDKSARCIPIVCNIPYLGKSYGPVSISFVARLWIHTLVEDFNEDQNRPIVIAASWSLPDGQLASLLNTSRTETETTLNAVNVMERKAKPPKRLPLIIAAAVVGGIILFGCLVIILWKCNFFKRTNVRKKRMELLRESQMQRE